MTLRRDPLLPPAAHRMLLYASGGPISSNGGRNGGKNAAKNQWFLDFLSLLASTFRIARNVGLTHFSERCRFCSEMQGAGFYRFGRLSNRALAAVGGKCRCGPLGRDGHVCFVGRRALTPPHDFVAGHSAQQFVGWPLCPAARDFSKSIGQSGPTFCTASGSGDRSGSVPHLGEFAVCFVRVG